MQTESKMTEKDVTIRELNTSEKSEVHKVWGLINKTYRSADGWTHEKDLVGGDRLTKKAFEEVISDETTTIFVATEKETPRDVIACIKMQVDILDTAVGPLSKPGGYFGMLAVLPKFQSKGIGNLLVDHVEKKCAELGFPNIFIDVLSERSELVRWYRRHGYAIIAQSTYEEADAVIKALKSKFLRPSRFILLSKTVPGSPSS